MEDKDKPILDYASPRPAEPRPQPVLQPFRQPGPLFGFLLLLIVFGLLAVLAAILMHLQQ